MPKGRRAVAGTASQKEIHPHLSLWNQHTWLPQSQALRRLQPTCEGTHHLWPPSRFLWNSHSQRWPSNPWWLQCVLVMLYRMRPPGSPIWRQSSPPLVEWPQAYPPGNSKPLAYHREHYTPPQRRRRQ